MKKPKKKPVDESALSKAKALSEDTKPVTDDAVRDLVARLEHDEARRRPTYYCLPFVQVEHGQVFEAGQIAD